MTEIKASDGKLYVSAIFDCYDLAVLGLAMDTNMKATLCEQTLDNAYKAYLCFGSYLHSDRGTQYTSELYRKAINKYGILQSMNSVGGRCHDNARCESMWARFKEELLYGRYDTTTMTVEQLKTSSGDTSSAIGITGGSALLTVGYLRWLSDNNTMLHYRRLHKVEYS